MTTGGSTPSLQQALRSLPAVDRVVTAMAGEGASALLTAAARRAVDRARASIRNGGTAPSFDEIVSAARSLIADETRTQLARVINATGVLIHTNLGRVPLGAVQLEAVNEIGGAYSNLEYELGEGRRGSRYQHARRLITALTGAESAIVVNNNAAAVLVTLAALCAEKEVVISRGELVEIGGEFRIPDVMSMSGTRLVEVGTTNRTHLSDYETAIGPDTAALLKVHPSNYQVVGFTAAVPARDLARLAVGRGVVFIHDLGSGLVRPPDYDVFRSDPPVEAALAEGADLVLFSGDKLLGGPQAGIIAGRKPLIEKIARHPLLRALRVDKLTLAALEATLDLYLEGRGAELPLWQMALAPLDLLEQRARGIAAQLGKTVTTGYKIEARPSRAVTGGGSMPADHLDSWAVSIAPEERSTAEIERYLRHGSIPVIARIDDDRLVVDLRTVFEDDDGTLTALLVAALQA